MTDSSEQPFSEWLAEFTHDCEHGCGLHKAMHHMFRALSEIRRLQASAEGWREAAVGNLLEVDRLQARIAELEAEVRDFNDMLRQAEEVSARGGP